MSKEFKLTLIDYGNARNIKAPNGQLVDAVGVTEFTGQRHSFHKPWKGLTTLEKLGCMRRWPRYWQTALTSPLVRYHLYTPFEILFPVFEY